MRPQADKTNETDRKKWSSKTVVWPKQTLTMAARRRRSCSKGHSLGHNFGHGAVAGCRKRRSGQLRIGVVVDERWARATCGVGMKLAYCQCAGSVLGCLLDREVVVVGGGGAVLAVEVGSVVVVEVVGAAGGLGVAKDGKRTIEWSSVWAVA